MTTLAERLAAAERRPPLPLAALVDRLRAAGRLRDADGPVDRSTVTGGVTDDSRDVRAGSVYVAVPGARHDGHRFVTAAAEAGAVAAIVEQRVEGTPPGFVQLVVARARPALGEAAAWWYGDPSRQLGVIGITGTDGKTTTSYLAAAALQAAGVPVGLIGTIATQVGGVREAHAEHATTPSAPLLQRALRAMVDAGDRAAIVETTSHGLALDRVAGIGYDVAIFTNLTSEHLELHGTLEAYRAAKLSLFERLASGPSNPPNPGVGWPRTGILNADDPNVEAFVAATRAAGARVVTYGVGRPADVRATSIRDDGAGLAVTYASGGGGGTIRSRLTGRFNARNLLAVVALGEVLGLEAARVRGGLESVAVIPGRMEAVDAGQPFRVVVDFAHTAASLGAVLEELRRPQGRLIAVFGSAGERDTAKRPEMGRVAAARADVVILTDEDPRGEDPDAILAEIAAGAEAAGKVRGRDLWLIADRAAAIRAAFERARRGDTVLLAGKGHETTIEDADGDRPWNERAEAVAALAELGWRAPA